jgi:hypothetical protein
MLIAPHHVCGLSTRMVWQINKSGALQVRRSADRIIDYLRIVLSLLVYYDIVGRHRTISMMESLGEQNVAPIDGD